MSSLSYHQMENSDWWIINQNKQSDVVNYHYIWKLTCLLKITAVCLSSFSALLDQADIIGKFSLTLTSRNNSRPIEDIVVSIYLGLGASSVSATATGDKRMPGVISNGMTRREENTAEGGVGGGTWEFDPHTQILRWRLSSLVATERAPSLTGSFTSSWVL